MKLNQFLEKCGWDLFKNQGRMKMNVFENLPQPSIF